MGKTESDRQLYLYRDAVEVFQRVEDVDIEVTSSTFENWECLPKFFIDPKKLSDSKPINREGIYKSQTVIVQQTPGMLPDGNSIFPGPKEELVLSVLIKMFVNCTIESEGSTDIGTETNRVTRSGQFMTTTYYEIHKELKKRGHESKTSQIKRSLDILNTSALRLIPETVDGKPTGKPKKSRSIERNFGPFIPEYFSSQDENDPTGRKRVIRLRFNSFIMDAIAGNNYRYLDFELEMQLGFVARTIFRTLNQYFRNASKPSEINNRQSYEIDLETILQQTGAKRLKSISNDIHFVEKSIKELVDRDIVFEYDVQKIYAKNSGKGRPKTIGAVFKLFASFRFVDTTIQNNSVARDRRPEDHRSQNRARRVLQSSLPIRI